MDLLFEDAEDLVLTHDQILNAIQLDLAAGILAEEDAIALLHVQRDDFAIFQALAFSNGENFAFLRLFLCALRNEKAAARFLGFAFNPFDNDAVIKRTNVHYKNLSSGN